MESREVIPQNGLALPWEPQATRYIPFNVRLPDGSSERVLVDAQEVEQALLSRLPRWLRPDVKHSFIEAELRTTVKAGVKIIRSMMLDTLFSKLPAGYPQPPHKVAKGEDYLLSFGLYLYRLFVDIQAASGGVTARVEREGGVYRVADVVLPGVGNAGATADTAGA